jgi:molecular chaperone GrpE
MLDALRDYLSPQEFVIDEQPVPVSFSEPGKGAPDDEKQAISRVFGEITGNDLASQLSALLVEQVRLSEKARQLEMIRPREDEFGGFVRQALPFLDNFSHLLEMAREHPASEELTGWLKGVEALYFRILNLFEAFGLRFINSVGKRVDLDYQEVIEYLPSRDHPHDTVIREVQKGVVFRDRLIRDAKVVVAYNE